MPKRPPKEMGMSAQPTFPSRQAIASFRKIIAEMRPVTRVANITMAEARRAVRAYHGRRGDDLGI